MAICFNDVDYDSVTVGYDLLDDQVVITNLNGKLLTVTFDGKPLNAIQRDSSHFFEIQLPMQHASHRVKVKLDYEADSV